MSQPTSIKFGVEFEMVIRPNQAGLFLLEKHFEFKPIANNSDSIGNLYDEQKNLNRTAIIDLLQNYLMQQGLEVNFDDNNAEESERPVRDYRLWSIIGDSSIVEGNDGYGIEIVTPILLTEVGHASLFFRGEWQSRIQMI
ncbi:hypothetical protein GGR51DRAFT_150816 [Nemania sp. FL0031]|nr:hypothetical protein GGR51DRAFT_150816 [Nemania sp. FL0031]